MEIRAGRLEAAARLTGSAFDVRLPPEAVVTSLLAMAGRSTAIVVGTVTDSNCYLAPDGRTIRTHFVVRIEEAVKGDVKNGQEVVIQALGGRVVFPSGAFGEVQVHETEPMRRGRRYALFAAASRLPSLGSSKEAVSRPVLGLTNGSYSVFELADDGRVWPALRKPKGDFGVATEYRGRSVPDFLVILRTLAK